MDQGDEATTPRRARDVAAGTAEESTRALRSDRVRTLRTPGLSAEIGGIVLVCVLALVGIGIGSAALYRHVYSASSFVGQYLSLLSEGRATDALGLPGVSVDSATLEAAGLPSSASDALLRGSVLKELSEITPVSEQDLGDGVTEVVFSFRVGPYPPQTVPFRVEQDGWVGIAPTWRFAQSPLAVLDVEAPGTLQFEVNGFDLDKRQVSPAGNEATAADPVSLLVFSPGVYEVKIDTAVATSELSAVIFDRPLMKVPVTVQPQATDAFVEVIQEKVNDFLDGCATQEVLQPSGCPFGYFVRNRVESTPSWSIAKYPQVTLEPRGSEWAVPVVSGMAHLSVDIRLVYDGSFQELEEDVPFLLSADVTIRPDGSASIVIHSPETE